MAAKKDIGEIFDDNLTTAIDKTDDSYKGPTVSIFLPKLEEEGGGMKVDQYEHVTIANEVKEWTYRVKRGERVDVPVPVFAILKERYPDL